MDFSKSKIENLIIHEIGNKLRIVIEQLIKNDCQKRNIINYNSEYDTFQFTGAINVFLEQAKDISKMNYIEDEEGQKELI